MDARTFLGMEPMQDELHRRMEVSPRLTTPGNFLFGGCGLGAALVALEAASDVRPSGRPVNTSRTPAPIHGWNGR